MPQGKSNDPREFVQWKQQVLLVDATKRRDTRAASLRHAGMVVHCASNGASAAALWEPDKYQLVLFEFSDAETDVRPFCEKLMRVLPRQKIGMYCATAPFILSPRSSSFRSPIAASREPLGSAPSQAALAAAAPPQSGGPGVAPDQFAPSMPESRPAAQQPISNRRQRALAAVARPKNGRYGLAQAAQEIAALRWRNPRYAAPVSQPMARPNRDSYTAPEPESHATIAARVLGGES